MKFHPLDEADIGSIGLRICCRSWITLYFLSQEDEHMAKSIQDREAKFGERMIELKVRFWTDGIAEGKGRIRPKHGWTRGMITIERNDAHEIVPVRGRPFNSLMEIPSAIEKILMEHGIQLHLCHKMDRYVLQE